MSKHTPAPWYLIQTDGTDFTAISRREKNGDLGDEILGTSEWLRATPEDLRLMAAAPDLLDALHLAEIQITADLVGRIQQPAEKIANELILKIVREALNKAEETEK